jgi:hypothetical protein
VRAPPVPTVDRPAPLASRFDGAPNAAAPHRTHIGAIDHATLRGAHGDDYADHCALRRSYTARATHSRAIGGRMRRTGMRSMCAIGIIALVAALACAPTPTEAALVSAQSRVHAPPVAQHHREARREANRSRAVHRSALMRRTFTFECECTAHCDSLSFTYHRCCLFTVLVPPRLARPVSSRSLLLACAHCQVSDLFVSLFSNPAKPYDNQLRPALNTSLPVIISTALRINLLFNVDSKEETFQLDLFVNEYWTDPRLAYDPSKFPLLNTLRIPVRYTPWLPDTFFFNAVKCLPIVDSSLTLSEAGDGGIFWSRHQSCTFHSSFDLLSFPFDSQVLAVRRTSFSYSDTELRVVFLSATGWRPDPQYDFTNSLWDFNYAFSNTSTLVFIETHSANAYLSLTRKSMSYILKMILPMFMLVLLSTLSYAIDPNVPPARVGFSVALILSIVTFNLVVSQDLPKINYATLIDWYVWYCFLFVVSALGEYAYVNNLIVSKKYGLAYPYLIDDFAMWTAPYTWILLNLYYWPLYDSVGVHVFLAMVWATWIAMNMYRVFWWNRQNEKRGMWAPTKQYVRYASDTAGASETRGERAGCTTHRQRRHQLCCALRSVIVYAGAITMSLPVLTLIWLLALSLSRALPVALLSSQFLSAAEVQMGASSRRRAAVLE